MNRRHFLPTTSLLFALDLLAWPSHAEAADLTAPSNPVISRCDRPFVFGFGSWEQAPKDFSVQPEGNRYFFRRLTWANLLSGGCPRDFKAPFLGDAVLRLPVL